MHQNNLGKRINPLTVKKTGRKKDYKISLPFMGKYSNVVKKKLSMLASNFLIDTKITIIWNSPRKIRNLFFFKDRLPMRLRSKFLYRYVCDGCNSVYIGKSKRHFLVRKQQ